MKYIFAILFSFLISNCLANDLENRLQVDQNKMNSISYNPSNETIIKTSDSFKQTEKHFNVSKLTKKSDQKPLYSFFDQNKKTKKKSSKKKVEWLTYIGIGAGMGVLGSLTNGGDLLLETTAAGASIGLLVAFMIWASAD